MEHEGFESLSREGIDLLLVRRRSQGDGCGNLRLSPGKPRGAVGPGKPPHLDADGANLFQGAAVDASIL